MSDFNVPVSMIPHGEYLDSSSDDDEYGVEDINISAFERSVPGHKQTNAEQTNAEHAWEQRDTSGDNTRECDDCCAVATGGCDDEHCQRVCDGPVEEHTVDPSCAHRFVEPSAVSGTVQDDESEENSCADDMESGARNDEAETEQGCHDFFDAEWQSTHKRTFRTRAKGTNS